MVLVICISSNNALYCIKFCENISKGLGVIVQTLFPLCTLQRGIILSKMQGELWFFDNALFLYQG